MLNIVYLHGFASDNTTSKAVLIKNKFSDKCNVITPTLSEKPLAAIKQIRDILAKDSHFLLVGTSLGGFYADYFNKMADIPCVLINPLVNVKDAFMLIGKNINHNTGKEFNFTEADYKYLEKLNKEKKQISFTESPEYVILASNDEVLPYKKALQYFVSPNHWVEVYPSGGHRFNNDKVIIETIEDMIEDIGNFNFSAIYNDIFESKKNLLNEHYVNLFSVSDKQKYWNEVKALIEESYSYIGGYRGDFNEFFDKNHLWKLIRKDGVIKAGQIYKDKLGRKAVAGFTDGTAEGKQAFKILIKEDLKLGRAWVEVSDKAENIYKYTMNATPLPHSLVKILMKMLHKEVIAWDEDGYHYTREINGVQYRKAIYGKADINET